MASTEQIVDQISLVVRNSSPTVKRPLSGVTITIDGVTIEVPFSSVNQTISSRKIY